MELWIGLAALKADPACKDFKRFGDGKGAYAHVAAWAESQEAFEQRIHAAAQMLDCILVELDDIEPLESIIKRGDYPEEFLDMRKTATDRPEDTVWGTFHIWHEDDAN